MIYRRYFLFLFFILVSSNAHASDWYIEVHSWGIALNAKVPSGSKRVFAINFEYERGCDPLFSSYTPWSGKMGSVRSIHTLQPNTAFLRINQNFYSFHGAIVRYTNTTETSIGITNDAWQALLRNQSNILFYENNRNGFPVPGYGLSGMLSSGLRLCMQNLRNQ